MAHSLSLRAIAKELGLSKSKVWRLAQKDTFPAPSECTAKAVPLYSLEAVRAYAVEQGYLGASRTQILAAYLGIDENTEFVFNTPGSIKSVNRAWWWLLFHDQLDSFDWSDIPFATAQAARAAAEANPGKHLRGCRAVLCEVQGVYMMQDGKLIQVADEEDEDVG